MGSLVIKDIHKSFGENHVVKGINLEVKDGSFVSLLGPSGCGKTTLLRMIAGLASADSGQIIVNGEDITDYPPDKRSNGMVFQNYALFPHMTVEQNIGYGLRQHKVPKPEITERVKGALEMVRLNGLEKRYPKELSGGQQQRVALARALVLNPTLLLLDEPLSNLDAKLRKEMRLEIRNIQQNLNITTVFVTHDQEEALTMSDTIAIMNAGVIEQLGSPLDLYENPKTEFVASFIGSTNILVGEATKVDGDWVTFQVGDIRLTGARYAPVAVGDKVISSQRPERLTLISQADSQRNTIACTVTAKVYMGASVRFVTQMENGTDITVDVPITHPSSKMVAGDRGFVVWEHEDSHVLIS